MIHPVHDRLSRIDFKSMLAPLKSDRCATHIVPQNIFEPTHIALYARNETDKFGRQCMSFIFVGGHSLNFPQSYSSPRHPNMQLLTNRRLPLALSGRISLIDAQFGSMRFENDIHSPTTWHAEHYSPRSNSIVVQDSTRLESARGLAIGSYLEVLCLHQLRRIYEKGGEPLFMRTGASPSVSRRKQIKRVGLQPLTTYPLDQWIDAHAGAINLRLAALSREIRDSLPNVSSFGGQISTYCVFLGLSSRDELVITLQQNLLLLIWTIGPSSKHGSDLQLSKIT